MPTGTLTRLRRICLALPEVEERISHGEPAWFVRGKKQFVTYADRHHDDRLAFWCAAPEGEQRVLVEADPARYFVPPYVGGRGWVGCYLDVDVDWGELAEVVIDAYVTVAPPKLGALVDRSRTPSDQDPIRQLPKRSPGPSRDRPRIPPSGSR